MPPCCRSVWTERTVSVEAPAEPTTVVPTPSRRECPCPIARLCSLVIPMTSGTLPPSAALIASSFPSPFCSETIGVAGLSWPVKGRTACSVFGALTKTKRKLVAKALRPLTARWQ